MDLISVMSAGAVADMPHVEAHRLGLVTSPRFLELLFGVLYNSIQVS